MARQEEFVQAVRRVDRIETSVVSIVNKIDMVLQRLDTIEEARARRRETMSQLLNSIGELQFSDIFSVAFLLSFGALIL
ncbi:unnamed protein product [Protopolystoma xenopodis]|uniref:Uncharacterized protein n=1 Tax=Protopolystoma xenopodis TaxID=117903 RepID=A0A448X4F7_9PLAT|nr:unnamed protein product [Protopolystoma xenopodis]